MQAGHEGSMVKWKFHLEQENRLYPGKETKFCITGSFLQLHSNHWLHNENVLSVLMASRKIFCMQYFMDWHETVLRTANIFPELEPRPENKACPNHSRAAAGGGPNPAPCCSPLGWIVPGSSPRWKSLRSLSGCSYWIAMAMLTQLRRWGELWWWKSLLHLHLHGKRRRSLWAWGEPKAPWLKML